MQAPPLQTQLVNIFFDESGGQDSVTRPSTMGGLLIPRTVYESSEMRDLNGLLRSKIMKLHFTKFTGDSTHREHIKQTIGVFSQIAKYSKMNVINYKRATLDMRYKHTSGQVLEKTSKREKSTSLDYATLMVYTKIPERIVYGLLRHYGQEVHIKTDIYVEKEGKYEKYNLTQRLKENLNTQSLYRAEQYWIDKCELVEKGKQIGVEITDLLLGMIRLIIRNRPFPEGITEEQLAKENHKASYEKQRLVIELLQNKDFMCFMESIKYYEWDSHKELSEVPFKDYLRLFMASNFRDFS